MPFRLEKKDILFLIIVPLLVAIIGISPSLFGKGESKSQLPVNKKIDSNSGIIADSLLIKGNGNAVAGHDAIVNNIYVDTTPRKGDTYIVNSKDQKGGLTVGKYVINRNITVVRYYDSAGKQIKNNYIFALDTVARIIYFQPKFGTWPHPFMGFPNEQESSVHPHYSNQNQNILKTEQTILFEGDSLHSMFATGEAATKEFYYLMHYNSIPKYLIFGNYPTALYKASFR